MTMRCGTVLRRGGRPSPLPPDADPATLGLDAARRPPRSLPGCPRPPLLRLPGDPERPWI